MRTWLRHKWIQRSLWLYGRGTRENPLTMDDLRPVMNEMKRLEPPPANPPEDRPG